MSENEQKQEEQPQTEATGDNPLGLSSDPPEKKAFYEKPEQIGNAVGEKVQSGLQPVGNVVGGGLGYVAKPVGGLVEPLVGGIMKSGEAFGDTIGVGFGNKEGGPAKQGEAELANLKAGEGNRLQTGDNPLGLNKG